MTPTRPSHNVAFIGAQRAVLDPVDAICAGLPKHAILFAAPGRRCRGAKDRGTAATLIGEKGVTPA